MRKKTDQLLMLIMIGALLIESCSKKDMTHDVIALNQHSQDSSQFFDTLRIIDLPIEITIDNSSLLRNQKVEVKREHALYFLLNMKREKLIQPTGGYYKYFNPIRVNSDLDSVNLVLYNRYCYDCYSGLILATFKIGWSYIDEVFIAGDSLELAQKEFSSIGNNRFSITELIADERNIMSKTTDGRKRIFEYIITDSGQIRKISERSFNVCIKFPLGEGNYRLLECNQQ